MKKKSSHIKVLVDSLYSGRQNINQISNKCYEKVIVNNNHCNNGSGSKCTE